MRRPHPHNLGDVMHYFRHLYHTTQHNLSHLNILSNWFQNLIGSQANQKKSLQVTTVWWTKCREELDQFWFVLLVSWVVSTCTTSLVRLTNSARASQGPLHLCIPKGRTPMIWPVIGIRELRIELSCKWEWRRQRLVRWQTLLGLNHRRLRADSLEMSPRISPKVEPSYNYLLNILSSQKSVRRDWLNCNQKRPKRNERRLSSVTCVTKLVKKPVWFTQSVTMFVMKNQYVHIVRWAQSLSIFGRSYICVSRLRCFPRRQLRSSKFTHIVLIYTVT